MLRRQLSNRVTVGNAIRAFHHQLCKKLLSSTATSMMSGSKNSSPNILTLTDTLDELNNLLKTSASGHKGSLSPVHRQSELWAQVAQALPLAAGTKEVDTLFALISKLVQEHTVTKTDDDKVEKDKNTAKNVNMSEKDKEAVASSQPITDSEEGSSRKKEGSFAPPPAAPPPRRPPTSPTANSSLSASPTPPTPIYLSTSLWVDLILASRYANIELSAPLCYTSDYLLCMKEWIHTEDYGGNAGESITTSQSSLPPQYQAEKVDKLCQALYGTRGIVPLSMRGACSNGEATLRLLFQYIAMKKMESAEKINNPKKEFYNHDDGDDRDQSKKETEKNINIPSALIKAAFTAFEENIHTLKLDVVRSFYKDILRKYCAKSMYPEYRDDVNWGEQEAGDSSEEISKRKKSSNPEEEEEEKAGDERGGGWLTQYVQLLIGYGDAELTYHLLLKQPSQRHEDVHVGKNNNVPVASMFFLRADRALLQLVEEFIDTATDDKEDSRDDFFQKVHSSSASSSCSFPISLVHQILQVISVHYMRLCNVYLLSPTGDGPLSRVPSEKKSEIFRSHDDVRAMSFMLSPLLLKISAALEGFLVTYQQRKEALETREEEGEEIGRMAKMMPPTSFETDHAAAITARFSALATQLSSTCSPYSSSPGEANFSSWTIPKISKVRFFIDEDHDENDMESLFVSWRKDGLLALMRVLSFETCFCTTPSSAVNGSHLPFVMKEMKQMYQLWKSYRQENNSDGQGSQLQKRKKRDAQETDEAILMPPDLSTSLSSSSCVHRQEMGTEGRSSAGGGSDGMQFFLSYLECNPPDEPLSTFNKNRRGETASPFLFLRQIRSYYFPSIDGLEPTGWMPGRSLPHHAEVIRFYVVLYRYVFQLATTKASSCDGKNEGGNVDEDDSCWTKNSSFLHFMLELLLEKATHHIQHLIERIPRNPNILAEDILAIGHMHKFLFQGLVLQDEFLQLCQKVMPKRNGIRPVENTSSDQGSFPSYWSQSNSSSVQPENEGKIKPSNDEVSSLSTFCPNLSQAYIITMVNKYHSLIIDLDLVKILGSPMAKSGDCRLFNLIDLCTLFSNKKIDYEAVDLMLECCFHAHDHHRAKALYGLLRDDYPGILEHLPISSQRHLQALKVLPRDPLHLFSDELKLPSKTMGATNAIQEDGKGWEWAKGTPQQKSTSQCWWLKHPQLKVLKQS